MKKVVLSMAFVFACLVFKAQVLASNDYGVLNKFSGSWLFESRNDTFLMKLKIDSVQLFKHIKDSMFNKPFVFGWHRYVENGKEIENTLPFEGNIEKSVAIGFVALDSCSETLNLTYYDETRDAYFKVVLSMLKMQKGFATWESKRQERVGGSGKTPRIPTGQTIPSPIILKRVSD